MSGTRILVVDDEPGIGRMLRTNLTARGYDVLVAETGEEALQYVGMQRPDLLILDLMLPGLSGLEVCRSVRATSDLPILVLSGHGEEQIKVRALDLGADDYLTKPFGIAELLARVRALLRRQPLAPSRGGRVEVGAFQVDLDTHQACREGKPLDLTRRELEVLVYLLRHSGRIVTHRQLLAEVWGSEYDAETQYLWVFINRLRRKIEPDPAHPRYIVTEPGIGYRLKAESVSDSDNGLVDG